MAITAQQAINEALSDLNDPAGVTWDANAFLLPRVGDAMAAIVGLVPAAYQVPATLVLTAGVTLQAVPTDVIRLVDITRNLGADGLTPGNSVSLVTKSQLDAVNPNWHQARLADQIKHWVYDPDRPTIFYVNPRPKVALRLEALVAKVPALGLIAAPLPIGDVYFNAIVMYLKYRAFDKAGRRRDPEKAQQQYTMFERALGIKKASDTEQAPRNKNP